MSRINFGLVRGILQLAKELRDGYQAANETAERANRGITEADREVTRRPKPPESVYPRAQKRAAGASTLNIVLHGRRLGYSGTKKKIHIVREIGYGDGVFLCGTLKAADEPLFIHHIVEEGLDLCKSCINLAKGGAH